MSKNNPLKKLRFDKSKKRIIKANHHRICRVNSNLRGRTGRTKQTGSD